ncbi:MAG: thioredoxin family protein, partial [Deltaproteobacteria bacterium]|nr:thioredoxin family protein [Deltaproteobacteria bacterium]
MTTRTIALLSLSLGAAVAVVPAFLPAGPAASVDAAGLLASGQFAVGLAATLLAGLLTALTPCVYPLIPVTVSVFGAGKQADGRGRAVMLTSAYVVGMGLVFALLGVAAARSGAAFGAQLANPWVVTGLAVFMLVLATSMFGAFELALPPALAERLTGVGGAGLLGAFLMGSVSGFLAAPCTGPVLSGLLAFVAKSQDSVLGGSLLFVYALGIGIPFFLIGAFTVQLPRSGPWMEWVKSLFGVGLLALAVLYLKDAYPAVKGLVTAGAQGLGRVPGAAVAGVLAAVGVGAGALHASFSGGAGPFARKALAVAVVAGALVLRAGALDAPRVGTLAAAWGLAVPEAHAATEVQWALALKGTAQEVAGLDALLAKAKAEQRPVMIDFFADWCAACKELDRITYVDAAVVAESGRFLLVKVDGTNGEDA